MICLNKLVVAQPVEDVVQLNFSISHCEGLRAHPETPQGLGRQ